MRPSKPKTVHDVKGYQEKCVKYQKCPLCYGCRRYSSVDPDCIICFMEDKKNNICNVNLHRDEVTAKMITKENIILPGELQFKSATI